jgi:hypothetical protein
LKEFVAAPLQRDPRGFSDRLIEGLESEEREDCKVELKANPKQGLLKMLRHDIRRTAVKTWSIAGCRLASP